VKTLFIFMLCLAPVAHGQSFRIDAGDSTLLNAEGASVTMYTPGSTDFLSLGLFNSHFVYGAGSEFNFKGFDVFTGDRTIVLASGITGVYVAERGASIERKRKHSDLIFFVGATGTAQSAGFFLTQRSQNFGTGLQYAFDFRKFKFDSIELLAGSQRSALESASWSDTHFLLDGSAGLLLNRGYLAGSASYSTLHFGANVERTNISNVASADVLSVAGQYGFLSASAGLFSSDAGALRHTGQTAGVSAAFDAVTARFSIFRSGNRAAEQYEALWRATPRIALSSTFAPSGTGKAFGFGGSYAGRLLNFSVSQNMLYFPEARGNPWERVLSLSVGINVRDTALTASTIALPSGGTRWSLSGSQWAYGKFATGPHEHASAGGKYTVKIFATTPDGTPLEGAAFVIGKTICVTNSVGECFARFGKARALAFTFANQESTVPGNWAVIAAPVTVLPGLNPAPLTVVLARK
jgi:hypothetical protein